MKTSRARHVLGPMMAATLPGATTGARSLSLARPALSKYNVYICIFLIIHSFEQPLTSSETKICDVNLMHYFAKSHFKF